MLKPRDHSALSTYAETEGSQRTEYVCTSVHLTWGGLSSLQVGREADLMNQFKTIIEKKGLQ
jgi:hypothetical protein